MNRYNPSQAITGENVESVCASFFSSTELPGLDAYDMGLQAINVFKFINEMTANVFINGKAAKISHIFQKTKRLETQEKIKAWYHLAQYGFHRAVEALVPYERERKPVSYSSSLTAKLIDRANEVGLDKGWLNQRVSYDMMDEKEEKVKIIYGKGGKDGSTVSSTILRNLKSGNDICDIRTLEIAKSILERQNVVLNYM